MLGIYALAMALQLMQRRVIDCGCGGQALPVSWVLVVRNGLLMTDCIMYILICWDPKNKPLFFPLAFLAF
jgi:hypothetical protein